MLWSTRRLVLVLSLLFFAGCQTFSGQPRQPYEDARVPTFTAVLSQDVVDGKTSCKDVECRNQIISSWLEAVDYYYHELERRITAVSQGINITGDIGVAAASAAGAVTNGAHAKSVLAAISTFFGGTKSTLDKNLYGEQSSQVLAARMRSLRHAALVSITAGLHKPLAAYPLVDAKIDLNNYFEAGTVDAAIADIQGESRNQSKEADKKVDDIRNYSYGFDDNSEKAREFWRSGDKIDAQHAQALQDWITGNIGPDIDIPSVIYASEFVASRKKLVAMLIAPYKPDDNTGALRKFWKPQGKEDPDSAKKLQDWVNKNAANGLDLASFLYSGQYAEARKKAVAELINPSH